MKHIATASQQNWKIRMGHYRPLTCRFFEENYTYYPKPKSYYSDNNTFELVLALQSKEKKRY